MKIKKNKNILFAADFAAAFDSISHNFLYQVLTKFGFSHNLVRWIEILHSNIESCILNNGFSTGFFKLHRGTRQGDPLAPYLFILVLEILGYMVKHNQNIKGIRVGEAEIKYSMFADDTTFFLKDSNSFLELKKTLSIFSKYSYLQVNYDKSEATVLGPPQKAILPNISCKWIDIHKDAIKILGVYFSLNSALLSSQNFDRVLLSFKRILNMWKSRNLTLFGKNIVLKSLALSKVLYITTMLIPPKTFLDEVKTEIVKFIWSNRKPKIAYKVLISKKQYGGIDLPDIFSRIKTQHIMLIKRLLEESLTPWKVVPALYLDKIGGRENIRSNFDFKKIPSNIPDFYKYCLADYAEFVQKAPETIKEVIIQPIWNNAMIQQKKKSFCIKELINIGIKTIGDIWSTESHKLRMLSDIININSSLYKKHYISWYSILKSIPKDWIRILNENISEPLGHEFCSLLCCSKGIIKLNSLKTKFIYNNVCSNQCCDSKGKLKFEKRVKQQLDWQDACNLVYFVSIDSYTRYFQFKILHDYIHVNEKLKKWQIIDSNRCSYCFIETETIYHLFVQCSYAVTLYNNIKHWLAGLPDLESTYIIYGILPYSLSNALENLLLVLYKHLLFYGRDNCKYISLESFKIKVKNVRRIEYNIARDKGKLDKHLNKWKNMEKFN